MGSGAYSISASDLELPTVGFPIVAARRYQSTQLIDGSLGYGWTSTLAARLHYATYLLAAPDIVKREAVIILPTGSRYRFVENPDGTFTPPQGRHDALQRHGDGSFDLTLQRSTSVFHFDSAGAALWFRDEFGNQLTYSYDTSGRLERVADDAGSLRFLDLHWGADGRLSSIVDSSGRQVSYYFDSRGLLSSAVDPLGRTTSYSYGFGKYVDLLSEVRDNWGRVISTVTYDSQDRVTTYTDRGELYRYVFNYQGNATKTSKEDSAGNRWVYTHGPGGLVSLDAAPAGAGNQATTYYPDGSVQQVTDEMGVKTYYVYDSAGRPLSITFDYQGSKAVRFEYSYDATFPDRISQELPVDPASGLRNPNWEGKRYTWYQSSDPAPGALRSVFRLRADGSSELIETYEYNTRGQVTAWIDAANNRTDYSYDPKGDLVAVASPPNNHLEQRPVTQAEYDGLGRAVVIVDPLGGETSLAYDAVGRLVSMTMPQAAVSAPIFTTSFSYDQYEAGTELTFAERVEPSGIVLRHGSDQHGRVVKTSDGLGAVTQYGYAGGLLRTVTDANGNVMTYSYDALHRLSGMQFPEGGEETYAYWPDGSLKSTTLRNGRVLGIDYDALKRITRRTVDGAPAVTYTYSGQKLVQIADSVAIPAETHVFTHDASFRVVTAVQGNRGVVSYTYTATGQLAGYAVAGGAAASYSYYPDQSLRSIAWSPVAGTFDYKYNLRGDYESVAYPNGQVRTLTYDGQGRLTSLSSSHPATGLLAGYEFEYDVDHAAGSQSAAGLRTGMTMSMPSQGLSSAPTKYYYDAANELVRVDYPAGAPFNGEVHQWSYDQIGNRVASSVDGLVSPYTYVQNSAGHNSARLIGDGAHTFAYNSDGSVASVSGALSATFSYDVWGHPVAASAGTANQSVQRDYSGVAVDGFLRSGSHRISADNGEIAILRDPQDGAPLAIVENTTEVSYVVSDALGNAVMVADAAGDAITSAVFDVWGRLRAGSEHPLAGFAGQSWSGGPVRLLGFRYYYPEIGRFLSEEPLRYVDKTVPVGFLYPYVANAPTLLVDPEGLAPRCTTRSTSERQYHYSDPAQVTPWWKYDAAFPTIPLPGRPPGPGGGPPGLPRGGQLLPGRRPPGQGQVPLLILQVCVWHRVRSQVHHWRDMTVTITVCESGCPPSVDVDTKFAWSPAPPTNSVQLEAMTTYGGSLLTFMGMRECRNPND